MNVKVLKKLRKESNNTYYLEYDGNLYNLIFDMKIKKISIAHYVSKDSADNMIRKLRNNYI